MKTITGIFPSFVQAKNAITTLRANRFDEKQLTVLTPGSSEAQIHSVDVTEGEHAGVGRALGALVGGAGGMSLAAMFIPGVGPILAAGLAAAALVGGAMGAAAGGAIEDATTEGIDADDIFPIENALRAGNSVVIVEARDSEQFDRARGILHDAEGQELRAVREQWWNQQRESERPSYTGDFLGDEPMFRRGFEAALTPSARGRSVDEAQTALQGRYSECLADPAFRRGFERGQEFHRRMCAERPSKAA